MPPQSGDSLAKLNTEIIACDRCPRLRRHCLAIAKAKRAAFTDWDYWGRPVPNFGIETAALLIVGLAPAAHGANRTGRMFTGDRSGQWLYRALHRFDFISNPEFERPAQEQRLHNCAITAIAHCAPPENKPTRKEIENCRSFFTRSVLLYQPRVIIALGSIAWSETLRQLRALGFAPMHESGSKRQLAFTKFAHGAERELFRGREVVKVIASYHPSQQNTFTGRLTEPMFDHVFHRAKQVLSIAQDEPSL